MTKYLTVITTVLVATQVVRVVQNHVSLFRQEKEIKKTCGWIKDNDISEKDFETQREVFKLLKEKLENDLTREIRLEKEFGDPTNLGEVHIPPPRKGK